jgi:hypothetical protein
VVYNGGFCIQWGKFRQAISDETLWTVTFPLTFTNTPYTAMVSPWLSYYRSNADIWFQVVSEPTTTTLQIGSQYDDSSDTKHSDGFNWVVYGPVT